MAVNGRQVIPDSLAKEVSPIQYVTENGFSIIRLSDVDKSVIAQTTFRVGEDRRLSVRLHTLRSSRQFWWDRISRTLRSSSGVLFRIRSLSTRQINARSLSRRIFRPKVLMLRIPRARGASRPS